MSNKRLLLCVGEFVNLQIELLAGIVIFKLCQVSEEARVLEMTAFFPRTMLHVFARILSFLAVDNEE